MIQSIVTKVLKKKNDQVYIAIFFKILTVRFGSEELMKAEVAKLSNNGVLDGIGMRSLLRLIYFDKLIPIFKPLLKAEGYIAFFEQLSLLESRVNAIASKMTEEERNGIVCFMNSMQDEDDIILSIVFPSRSKSTKGKFFKWLLNQKITSKLK